jgi:hypothetical protein
VQCAQPRALLTLSGAGPPTAKVVASGGYSNRPLQVATQEGLQHTERSCVATTRVLQPPPLLRCEDFKGGSRTLKGPLRGATTGETESGRPSVTIYMMGPDDSPCCLSLRRMSWERRWLPLYATLLGIGE